MSACTRSECKASQKELETLSLELEEIENENIELHEALDVLKQNARKNSNSKNDEMDTDRKSGKIENLEIATLKNDISVLEGKLRNSELSVSNLEKLNSELKSNVASLELDHGQLQNEMEEKNKLLLLEKKKKNLDNQNKNEQKNARVEYLAILKENEDLQSEMEEMKMGLEKIATVALEYENNLRLKEQQIFDIGQTVSQYESERKEMMEQQNNSQKQIRDLLDKITEMDEAESAVDSLMEQHQVTLVKQREEMEKTILELRKQILDQKNDTNQADHSASMQELEQKLILIEEMRSNDRTVIRELKQQLDQRELDLEMMIEQHGDMHGIVEKAIAEALQGEQKLRTDLKNEISLLKTRTKDQRTIIQDFESKHIEVERDLTEIQAWKIKYEQGAGYDELIEYQKKLKLDVKRRDADNIQLRNTINEHIETVGKLQLCNERLKAECGKDVNFNYDDTEIEQHMNGEIGSLRSLVQHLEQELEDADKERIRLLNNLRKNAKEKGIMDFNDMNLSTDQVLRINEYILQVKEGTASSSMEESKVPFSGRTSQEQQQVQQLQLLLVKAEAKAQTLEDQMNKHLAVAPVAAKTLKAHDQKLDAKETSKTEKQNLLTESVDIVETIRHELRSFLVEQRQQFIPVKRAISPHRKSKKSSLPKKSSQAKPKTKTNAVPKVEIPTSKPASVAPMNTEQIRLAEDAFTSSPSDSVLESPTNKTDVSLKSNTESAVAETKTENTNPIKEPDSIVSLDTIESKNHLETPNVDQKEESMDKPVETNPSDSESEMDQEDSFEDTSPSYEELAYAPNVYRQSPNYNISAETIASATAAAVTDALSIAQRQLIPVLESSEEVDELAVLQLQLTACLDEVTKRDKCISLLKTTMKQYETKLKLHKDQQSVMYHEFAAQEETRQSAVTALRNELEETTRKCEELKIRSTKFTDLCKLVSLPTEGSQEAKKIVQLENETRDNYRKLAIYEVNEQRLSRRYNLLVDEIKREKLLQGTLRNEKSTVENTCKSRICYLEEWKLKAELVMQRIQYQLDHSVPETDFDSLKRQHVQLKQNYMVSMHRVAEYRTEYVKTRELPNLVKKLQSRIALLSSQSNHDDVVNARIDELEVELQNQSSKVYLLKDLIAEKEAAILNAMKERDLVESNHGATKEEAKILNDRILELEDMYHEVTQQVNRQRTKTEIALHQVEQFRSTQAANHLEVQTLREQLLDFQSESDNRAIIGKLQQESIEIKKNYQLCSRKVDSSARILREKEGQIRELEHRIDVDSVKIRSAQNSHYEELQSLKQAVWTVENERGIYSRPVDSTGSTMSVVTVQQLNDVAERVENVAQEQANSIEERNVLEKQLRSSKIRIQYLKDSLAKLGTTIPEQEIDKAENDDMEMVKLLLKRDANARKETVATSQHTQISLLQSQISILEKRLKESGSSGGTMNNTSGMSNQLKREDRKKLLELNQIVSQQQLRTRQLENELEDAAGVLAEKQRMIDVIQAQLNPNGKMKNVDFYSTSENQDQEERMQRAAQVTISSLTALVDEKNQRMEEYKRKYEELQLKTTKEREFDSLEVDRWNEKQFNDNDHQIGQLRDALERVDSLKENESATVIGTMEHLQSLLKDAHELIADREIELNVKETELTQLKNKLQLANDQMEEVAKEKDEVQEELSDRSKELSELKADTTALQMIKKLRKQLESKDEKLASLKTAVIKLKDEFMKAEERHAIDLVEEEQRVINANKSRDNTLEETVAPLREKISMLQDKLREALKDVKGLRGKKEHEIGSKDPRAEVLALQDKEKRLRFEWNKARENYTQKLKEMEVTNRALEKQVKILQAQNSALRDDVAAEPSTKPEMEKQPRGSIMSEELEVKWRRRVQTLNKRLEERNIELETCQSQLSRCTALLEKTKTERDATRKQIKEPKKRVLDSSLLEQKIADLSKDKAKLEAALQQAKRSASMANGSKKASTEREKDLEGVITSMKRVIEKLRNENERIRKHSVSTTKTVEQNKRIRDLRQQVFDLKDEKETLETKLNSLKDLHESTHQSNIQLKNQVQKQRQKLRETSPKSQDPITSDLKHQVIELEERNTDYASQIADLRKVNKGLLASSQKDVSSEYVARIEELETNLAKVDDERERLLKELSAFDLEFFEEIEDLKYNYANAVKELEALKS